MRNFKLPPTHSCELAQENLKLTSNWMANKNIIANNFSLKWLVNSISIPTRVNPPASGIVVKMLLNSNQSLNKMIVGSQQWEIARVKKEEKKAIKWAK